MARTSKKNKKEPAEAEKKYSAAIYGRLSVDSHNEKNESITTQIAICEAYLKQQTDMVFFQCYTDLGRTGSNFERPGFCRMMADVRQQKVNCIIVKDLSRFGRNHIETGNYLQKIFPFLGVRFIAVEERFDSLYAASDETSINLKNLANEMYARDIAARVRNGKALQRERGSYTGGIAPYGYRAERAEDIRRLVVSEAEAEIVREIYRQYREGSSLKAIVSWLYGHGIHRPADCHAYGHPYCEEGEQLAEWSRTSVKMILSNPVYAGHLVQGRACGKDGVLRERHSVVPEEVSVREHTHEAVVEEDAFLEAAVRLEQQAVYCNSHGFSKKIPAGEDVFQQLLYCGECGAAMSRCSSVKELGSKDRVRTYAYYCRHSGCTEGQRCSKKYITKETLTELVRVAIYRECVLSGTTAKELAGLGSAAAGRLKREAERSGARLEKEIKRLERRAGEEYLRYRSGEISREEFCVWKEKNRERIHLRREQQRESLCRQKAAAAAVERQGAFLCSFLKEGKRPEPDRELLHAIFERIEVFPEKRLEFSFRFREKNILREMEGADA